MCSQEVPAVLLLPFWKEVGVFERFFLINPFDGFIKQEAGQTF